MPSTKASSPPDSSSGFATGRALVVGCVLVVLNAHWQTPLSSILDIELSDLALFCNVITILFLLALVNGRIARYAPRRALQRREVLIIYTMLATATALNGTDMIKCLVSLMGNGTWHATPENDWANLFGRYLPEWITVQDRQVLRGYYEGDSTLYTDAHLRAWAPRAAAWTAFTVTLMFVMFCLARIVRRQWITNERLSYPIAQLPFEMAGPNTTGGTSLFGHRLLWIGFGIAAVISVVNQTNVWYPSVPALPVQPLNLARYFPTRPWNAMGYMYRTFYPFAVGMAYLMPLDLILSTWVFHLVWQAERVVGSAYGFGAMPGFPYAEAQVRGGWIALLCFAVWKGRRHFAGIFANVPDAAPREVRLPALGAAAGAIGLMVFCHYLGMSFWLLIPFFLLYFGLATAITRIRAELGPAVHTLSGATPDYLLMTALGSRRLGPGNIVGFGLLHWILGSAGREHPMPIQLEAMKFAERMRISSRGLMAAVLLAAGVGSLAGWWAYLHDAYTLGVEAYPEETWAASVGFRLLTSRLQAPTGWQPMALTFTLGGFLLTTALAAVRTQYLWWPFHPVGYVISGRWGIGRIFFPLVIASVAKWSVLRFAGVSGYRRSVPFFLGLIIGDFTLGMLWATIGLVFHVPVYVFWTG
ncbi:hypothetical protein HN371_03240 [Candidatus Poribacteria bacterium]|nr:hypothetical protein [Candidatus Poribacteria bacterium]MBT5537163.1 hypothetical protein [Candidatus Poribacteria bacterium]MBT5714137.1 hypothetical protein [Candidatus Poribacteria bacterium]MBT7097597.1 hypothetical protein [Candidatus Poribacteria bacterium]MBT7809413.1 hypothetical protein [Candidatus Poribacteria bacterium]